jgi:putative Mg2+ transporter-C (MgtC) family protein
VEPELSYLLRIAVAAGLAGLLGYERERARKPAGLRTHMLVGIASALYTSLAMLAYEESVGAGGTRADPIRAIQAVALGVGFLGGGMIVTRREGRDVSGLTTAASIWATAAVGIAAGLAHYVLAVGATALLLLVLRLLVRFDLGDDER